MKKKIVSKLSYLGGMITAATLLYVAHFLGVAHAAAAATVDPVGTAQSSVDGGMTVLTSYGPIIGGMYLAYAVANSLVAKYHGSSWFAQGKRLAIATAALGVAGAALQALAIGTPWSGVLMTAVAAAFKLLSPVVAGAPAAKPATAGFAARPLVFGLGMVGLVAIAVVAGAGCGASQRETTIKTTFLSVDAARDGFLAYDRSHELSLVAHCDPAVDSKEQCTAKVAASQKALADYQAKRAKVDLAFATAYRSMTAAQIINTDQSVASMAAAAAQLYDLVKPFIGGK